jgi:hypothetical protein
MSFAPDSTPSIASTQGPHAYRLWETWKMRDDTNYDRYVGMEVLETCHFFMLTREKHGSWGVGSDNENNNLTVRTGLDAIRKQGITLYPSILEAMAGWDADYPEK